MAEDHDYQIAERLETRVMALKTERKGSIEDLVKRKIYSINKYCMFSMFEIIEIYQIYK